jgi:hypothetical protein
MGRQSPSSSVADQTQAWLFPLLTFLGSFMARLKLKETPLERKERERKERKRKQGKHHKWDANDPCLAEPFGVVEHSEFKPSYFANSPFLKYPLACPTPTNCTRTVNGRRDP